MATLNQVLFIGRLGKDPDELKVTSEGKPYIQFSLAVDLAKDQTMWIQVTAWEKTAEAVERFARKGTLVLVQGKLQMHKYRDKTQAERLSVEISASNVQILEKKSKEGDQLPDEVVPEAYGTLSTQDCQPKKTEHPTTCGSIRIGIVPPGYFPTRSVK